jgi:hypothetical protein
MRENKRGDLLMDAIGSIDDRFIFEAQVALPKNRYAPLRRILAIAACTVVVMTLMLSLFVGMLSQTKNESQNDGVENIGGTLDSIAPNSTSKPENVPKTDSVLADTLIEMKSETMQYSSPLERDILFDGSTHLIWRYEGEEDYRICKISYKESSKIKKELNSKAGFSKVDADTDHGELEGFWICFGDGLVYSPYLESSNGNIGYGQIFDYDPELETSEKFNSLIKNAIENAN